MVTDSVHCVSVYPGAAWSQALPDELPAVRAAAPSGAAQMTPLAAGGEVRGKADPGQGAGDSEKRTGLAVRSPASTPSQHLTCDLRREGGKLEGEGFTGRERVTSGPET